MSNDLPYEDLLVVSLEQAVAAPLCSVHFAQGGARVIKIERESGDFARNYDSAVHGSASYFVWANHGKQSLVLDIKDLNDAEFLHRILAKADVFIQNLAPGAAARAGFDSAALREANPRLITCDISGYGETGDYRNMKAYDFLVQCESGLVAVNGAPQAPGRIGVSICDIAASKDAIIGIQQALVRRATTNTGAGVKISLFDTAADWMTVPLMHHDYGRGAPKPAGLKHPSIAPYGGFETADGKILAISIQNEREWVCLCRDVLNDADMAQDPRFDRAAARVENRREVDDAVARLFVTKNAQTLKTRLDNAGIAYGSLNSVSEFSQHPQLRRAPVTLTNGTPAQLVAPAIQSSYDQPGPSYGKVPDIGEHSADIRAEFSK